MREALPEDRWSEACWGTVAQGRPAGKGAPSRGDRREGVSAL